MFKNTYFLQYSDNSAAVVIVGQGCCQIVSLDFFRSKEITSTN